VQGRDWPTVLEPGDLNVWKVAFNSQLLLENGLIALCLMFLWISIVLWTCEGQCEVTESESPRGHCKAWVKL